MSFDRADVLKILARGNLLALVDELDPLYRDRDLVARDVFGVLSELKDRYPEEPEDVDMRMLRVKYKKEHLFKFLRHADPRSADSVRLGLVRLMRDCR